MEIILLERPVRIEENSSNSSDNDYSDIPDLELFSSFVLFQNNNNVIRIFFLFLDMGPGPSFHL